MSYSFNGEHAIDSWCTSFHIVVVQMNMIYGIKNKVLFMRFTDLSNDQQVNMAGSVIEWRMLVEVKVRPIRMYMQLFC